VIAAGAQERGYREELVREYLTRHIVYELGPRHIEGLELFRKLTRSVTAKV
jgi:predicted solute-binding protein